MATFLCPKHHESVEPDYCSECGARIEGAPQQQSVVLPSLPVAEFCPTCGTAREQRDIVFCEICGYNFATGVEGELPASPPVAAAPAPVPRQWTITVSVDPTLHESGSPEPPANFAPVTVDLNVPVSLIGRRSTARAIFPEVDLSHDNAVSHRHALLQFDAAGAPVLRDIGAANGTRLNGKTVDPLQDHPLADGDEITLGHWSRLVLKALD
jgi:hypothetical protein